MVCIYDGGDRHRGKKYSFQNTFVKQPGHFYALHPYEPKTIDLGKTCLIYLQIGNP